MKKARFIGILMAAVIAAVPFTGTAKNMGINSIEAKAYNHLIDARYEPYTTHWTDLSADRFLYGVHIDEPNNRGMAFYGEELRWKWISNGDYVLLFDNGVLTIRKYITKNNINGRPSWVECPYYNVFYFNTGGDVLNFQLDGNLVVYDSKTGRPTAHTNTYNQNKSTNQGYSYDYVLTDDGRLLIYRYNPGGRSYRIIWDSSKDKMYRI